MNQWLNAGRFVRAKEAAEKPEKQIPRGLKSARDDKRRDYYGTAEVVPLQNIGASQETEIVIRLKDGV